MSETTSELQRDHLELLLQANALLSSSLSIDEILERLMDQVIEVLRAERGFVILFDESTGDWEFKTARAIDQATVEGEGFGISRSVIHQVREQGQAIFTSDAQQDARFREQASVGLHSLRSILCAPLVWKGEVRGAVYTDHRLETGLFTGAQKELLAAIAAQAGRALENALLYETLRDVHETSMERARKELAETQDQLLQTSKLAAVGQLAAGLAHEVNNPLSALALNIGALKKKTEDQLAQRRLGIMEGAVGRCQEIIQRLLRFSQPRPLQRREARIDSILEETLELVAPGLEQEQIEIRKRLQPATAEVDPDQIGQVFLNLILNARDALAGREVPWIEVSCEPSEQEVVVAVLDNGSGIPEEIRSRILEPFFTTKEVGSGVGLGLAVSYGILQEHKANLKILTETGKGTRFTITFTKEK